MLLSNINRASSYFLSLYNFNPSSKKLSLLKDELVKLIDIELKKWNEIKDSELDKINAMILENNIQLISIN